jgi:hypothetical protein
MSIIGIGLNLLLAMLLGAALVLGWRLNKRLKALRDNHEGFAKAVRELDVAAARAEKGLADLHVATDEALDLLGDRIEKGRALAAKLEKLIDQAPAEARRAPDEAADRATERRLGALLAAAREARPRSERPLRRELAPARQRPSVEDDLFEDAPEPARTLSAIRGGRR